MNKLVYFILLLPFVSFGQNYASYFTGNTIDLHSIENQQFDFTQGCALKLANSAANRTNWFKKLTR